MKHPANTPADLAARPAPAAIVYQGELDYLSRCILDSPDIETGGELFGFWTASGLPAVLYAIGPGPRANHQVAFFNQDLDYLTRVGTLLIDRFGLQHIGEWHSHHQLGLAHPSGHDAATMVRSIASGGLVRFLLCIGNCTPDQSTVNAFSFHRDAGFDYRRAAWIVKPGPSPFRAVVDAHPDLAPVLVHPFTPRPSMGPLFVASDAPQFAPPDYSADYWLNDRRNNLALKQILDFLSEASPGAAVSPKLDAARRVVLRLDIPDGPIGVLFPEGFPFEPPRLLPVPPLEPPARGISRLWTRAPEPPPPPPPLPPAPDWCFTGDIFQSFRAWWTALFPPAAADDPAPIGIPDVPHDPPTDTPDAPPVAPPAAPEPGALSPEPAAISPVPDDSATPDQPPNP